MSTGRSISLFCDASRVIRSSLAISNVRNLSVSQAHLVRRIQPCVEHDVTIPRVNLNEYDPDGIYSEAVQGFIKSRQFENEGGRQAMVVSFPSGKPVGLVTLNNFVFGVNPRIDILHRVSVWERAIIRAGTASTKTRAEVRGGGRKPRPQKGTGRSRQGSIRSPHWRGGGVVHGPKPRSYFYPLPMQVIRMGIRCGLSSRLAQGDLHVVESFDNVPTDLEELVPMLARNGWLNALAIDRNNNPSAFSTLEQIETFSCNHSHEIKVGKILQRHKLLISLSAIRRLEHDLCEDNRIITLPSYQMYHELAREDKEEFYLEDSTYVPPKKFWQNNKKRKPPARPPPRRR